MFSLDEDLRNSSYCFSFIVLLILVHKHWVEVSFFWVTSGFPFIPTMTSMTKGQVKYSCAAGRVEKRVKADFSNVSYTLFLQELII